MRNAQFAITPLRQSSIDTSPGGRELYIGKHQCVSNRGFIFFFCVQNTSATHCCVHFLYKKGLFVAKLMLKLNHTNRKDGEALEQNFKEYQKAEKS